MAKEKENGVFTGRLKVILPLNIVSPTFKKIEFVVVTDEQYPQPIKFELTQDRVNLLGGFMPGDEVKLWFNIRGKEWIDPTGKVCYFTSFVAWRIQKISNGYVVPTRDGAQVQHNFNFKPEADVFGPQPTKSNTSYSNQYQDEDGDDLPF